MSPLARSFYWRPLHFLGFFFAVVILGVPLYLQIVEFVMPCQLCIYLRLLIITYAGTSFVAIFHYPRLLGQIIYYWLFIIYSLLGMIVSGYILWLQNLSTERIISCGQGAGASLSELPFGNILMLLFSSYGSCIEVSWRLWGMTLPVLALAGFGALLLFEIGKRQLLRQRYA